MTANDPATGAQVPLSRWPNATTAYDISQRIADLAQQIRRTVDEPNDRDYIGQPAAFLENARVWEQAVQALEAAGDAWQILSYQLPNEVVGENFNRGTRR